MPRSTLMFAVCPRPRRIIKPVLTARSVAVELSELRAGILFGPQRAGLDNDVVLGRQCKPLAHGRHHSDSSSRFPRFTALWR